MALATAEISWKMTSDESPFLSLQVVKDHRMKAENAY
jgi:hypothetical protein